MLDRLRRLGLLDKRSEKKQAAEYFEKLRVKTPSLDTPSRASPAAISRRSPSPNGSAAGQNS
jgi:hypothetical protein